jgi:hypothetical protein
MLSFKSSTAMRRAACAASAALALTALVLAGSSPANAATSKTIPLSGQLYPHSVYTTVTYFSTPHVKGGNANITFHLDHEYGPGVDTQDGGSFNIGIRNQSGADEDSSFPTVAKGQTVKLYNIRNKSYTWGATTYYFNGMHSGLREGDEGNGFVGSSTSNWN